MAVSKSVNIRAILKHLKFLISSKKAKFTELLERLEAIVDPPPVWVYNRVLVRRGTFCCRRDASRGSDTIKYASVDSEREKTQ